MRRNAISRFGELWALLGLVTLFFRRPLTSWTFHYRDLELLFYPKKVFFAAAIRHGHIPLWDPMTSGGQPFLGSPNNMSFNPLNVAYLLFSPLTAFNLNLVLAFAGCAFGAWWLARTLGISRTGSFVAGATYALCGYTLSSANLQSLGPGLPWIPIAIAFALRALRDGDRWMFVGATLSAAVPFLGGAEITPALFLTLALFAAAVDTKSAPRGRAAIVAAIVIFALALSLIQMLPASEVIRESSRGIGHSYDNFTFWSVNPRRLPEIVLPQFFGRTDSFDLAEYWGGNFETLHAPYILSIYFGVLVIVLALAGGVSRGSEDLVPRRTLLALAIAGIVLSLGRNLPGFRILYEAVPFIDRFRFPVKAMLVSLLPIAILAGRGIDVVQRDERAQRRVLAALVACAVLAFAGADAFGVSVRFRTWFAGVFFAQQPYPRLVSGVSRSLWHAAFFAFAGAVAVAGIWRGARRWSVVLAAVIALDLVAAGHSVNSYAPRDLFNPPPVAGVVRRMIGDGRLYPYALPEGAALRVPTSNEVWRSRWVIQTLGRYTAGLFGIPVIFNEDYDHLAPLRMSRLTESVGQLPWPKRLPVLQLGAVRAFMSSDDVRLPGVERIARVPSFEVHPLYLYSLNGSPLARFVSRAVFARSDRHAFELLVGGADPAVVILEGAGQAQRDCGSAAVAVLERGSGRARYSVNAPCSGYVVFAETWYPAWRVTVDGAERPLVHADYAFSAVAVGPGPHTIERRYEPSLPMAGAIASGVALVLLFALSGALMRRASAPPVETSE